MEYLENLVGCELYKYGRCGLYPEKVCIGEECGIWKLYKEKKDYTENLNICNLKSLFLLRVICNSENSFLYIKDNDCVIEFIDCGMSYCFLFCEMNEIILEKFFDLPIIENKFPENYEFEFNEFFGRLGI